MGEGVAYLARATRSDPSARQDRAAWGSVFRVLAIAAAPRLALPDQGRWGRRGRPQIKTLGASVVIHI